MTDGNFLSSLFAGPYNADSDTAAMVRDMAREFNVMPIPAVLFDPQIEGQRNMYSSMRPNDDGAREYAIILPPDYREQWPNDQVKGIIAHELAHIANRDAERTLRVRRQHELQADAWAAKHGFGDVMIAALNGAHANGDDVGEEEIDNDHPTHKQRIAAIRRAMEVKS